MSASVRTRLVVTTTVLVLFAALRGLPGAPALLGQAAQAPAFDVDSKWPVVPNNWVLGEVTSIAVDGRDHIWVLHRPRSIPAEQRDRAAPPVLEFDTSGKLLASWGGQADGFEWPEREHGIYVDARGFVWISGNGGWPKPSPGGSTDDMLLKFSNTGKLVRQIGSRGKSTGNADTVNVHQPGDVFVHAPTNELYVADGYGNNRVIVFDAESGAFKRMWGAFGNRPEAPPPAGRRGAAPAADAAPASPDGPPQFGLVHAVKVSNDGTVYVADRTNNRIQMFTTEGKYLRQVKVAADSGGVTPVPAGFAFSPDPKQQYLYVVDSGPMRVVVFDRSTMTQVGAVGSRGPKPGQFDIVHHMASDSAGNIYTAEIVTNRRAQRLLLRRR
jgi:DNA-binding beta-propeller fold protein YncE